VRAQQDSELQARADEFKALANEAFKGAPLRCLRPPPSPLLPLPPLPPPPPPLLPWLGARSLLTPARDGFTFPVRWRRQALHTRCHAVHVRD
jgi:hypothetical protein